jgi:hypothetical protein
MPTLEELRRWARGERIEGLPQIAPRKEVDVERPKLGAESSVRRLSGKYKLNAEGTDALLQFGSFTGHAVSALVTTARGRKYLAWIVSKDFDEDLKAVCRYHMELHKRVKR